MVAAAVSTCALSASGAVDPIVLHERHGLIVTSGLHRSLRGSPRTAAVVRADLEVAAQAMTFAAYLAESGASVVPTDREFADRVGGRVHRHLVGAARVWSAARCRSRRPRTPGCARARGLVHRQPAELRPAPRRRSHSAMYSGVWLRRASGAHQRAVERVGLPQRVSCCNRSTGTRILATSSDARRPRMDRSRGRVPRAA